VHPIAFQLGSLPVRWYGVMMALAFLAGLWTATRRARLANVAGDVIADVTLWLMLGSIVGARLVYVITYWKQEFASQPFPEVFMIQHGGLVYYGGLIGAIVAGIIYLAWKKLPVWKIADVLAPSIALGSVFGRLGCLLNGCCYGHACELPWAIHFPADHETHAAAVHPTQIYDALLNLVLYLALAGWFRRRKFDGQIFAAYLIGYAVFRSIADYFRGDYPADQIHAGFFTPAQVVSLPILAAGLALMVFLARRPRKTGDGK
jgi:phosphatidylglycerol:prolipoprotein diacylglycerol transferase